MSDQDEGPAVGQEDQRETPGPKDPELALARAAHDGRTADMKEFWAQSGGTLDANLVLRNAVRIDDRLAAMELAKEWGATDFDTALCDAALSSNLRGMEVLLRWREESLPTQGSSVHLDEALARSARTGHLDGMRFLKERGATDFGKVLASIPDGNVPAPEDPPDIVYHSFCGSRREAAKELLRSWLNGEATKERLRSWLNEETESGLAEQKETEETESGSAGQKDTEDAPSDPAEQKETEETESGSAGQENAEEDAPGVPAEQMAFALAFCGALRRKQLGMMPHEI